MFRFSLAPTSGQKYIFDIHAVVFAKKRSAELHIHIAITSCAHIDIKKYKHINKHDTKIACLRVKIIKSSPPADGEDPPAKSTHAQTLHAADRRTHPGQRGSLDCDCVIFQ